jgi:hypothetical protein
MRNCRDVTLPLERPALECHASASEIANTAASGTDEKLRRLRLHFRLISLDLAGERIPTPSHRHQDRGPLHRCFAVFPKGRIIVAATCLGQP